MKIYIALNAIMLISFVSGEKIDSPIPCRNTSDCMSILKLPKDAFCDDGYCMCPTKNGLLRNCSSIDAFIHEKRIPGPLVFRTCKHEQDCKFEGGFCNTTINQCDCSKDYVPSSNKQHCVRKALSIDAPCTDPNQCLAFLANTTCHNDKCTCISGYHYVDNACWRKAGLGKPCTSNQECSHMKNFICTSNMTCGCAAETVLSADGERCLPVAQKFNDKCTEVIQCTTTFQYSSCINKVCQCKEGYHYEHDMTRCFINRELGAECANNYECYQAEDYENDLPTKSLMCVANKCTCAINYIRDEDRCVSAGSSIATPLSIIVLLIALICNSFSG